MTLSDAGKSIEARTTLNLLSDIEKDEFSSQRSFAGKFGVALGLTNAYVRRCLNKGWIKMRRVPARRYAYYLTPKGFTEKSRLVGEYLAHSLDFFRRARSEYLEAFLDCESRGWTRVALYGHGELVEIATLAARETTVELVLVIAPGCNTSEFAGLPVVTDPGRVGEIDAVLIAETADPQGAFDSLMKTALADRLITPPLLHVMRGK